MAGAIDYPISKPGDIYGGHYGVVTSYTLYGETYPGAYAGAYSASIGGSYEGMDNSLKIIINGMLTAARNEEARELALFQRYINLIPENTKLRKDFEGLIRSKNYSQAFDTLIKTYSKMYDFNKTLKENQDMFNEINDLFLTRPFLYGLMDQLGRSSHKGNSKTYKATFGKINLSMTGAQLVQSIIDEIEQEVVEKKRLQGDKLKRYKNFLKQMKTFIEEIFIDAYGIEALNNSLSTLENNSAIKKKRSAGNGKKANVPLNQLIYEIIYGQLNGMGLEVIIDFNSGGVRTGSIRNNGGDIKADDVILMSANGSFTLDSNPQLKQEVSKMTEKYELDEFLARGAFEDNFIVMVSGKDQSTSLDFNNQFSNANKTVGFAENASLNKRIPDIEMFSSVSGVDTQGLIFALSNLASDLVCAGEDGAVKQALGAMCANWMFDDIGELIINVPMTNNSNKICVYNISGRYYTLSDILKKTLAKIKGVSNTDLVKVNLSFPKDSSYSETALSVDEGTPRWEAVRGYIMKNTTIGFDLRTKNLFNAFY